LKSVVLKERLTIPDYQDSANESLTSITNVTYEEANGVLELKRMVEAWPLSGRTVRAPVKWQPLTGNEEQTARAAEKVAKEADQAGQGLSQREPARLVAGLSYEVGEHSCSVLIMVATPRIYRYFIKCSENPHSRQGELSSTFR
jgi:hypothetical protein